MFYYLSITITFFFGVGLFFFRFFKKPFSFKFFPFKRSSNRNKISKEAQMTPEERERRQVLETQSNELHKTYEKELADLGVGTLSMSTTSHHYSTSAGKNSGSNTNKIKRLTSELKQISSFLPVYYSNAIFIRYDESQMDLMKAVIMGADDTPYAHGAYLFDIYFDNSYPQQPPKVNLMTTGGNKIRFNPNLYNNGYVCLSLLGTWSGSAGENWTPNSNLLQILMSIQSLVMTDEVLYNEPSYVAYKKNQRNNNNIYQKQDIAYCNIVKFGNVKHAILEMLEKPPVGFEEVIKKHFYYKKFDIIRTCDKWLEEAETQKDLPAYTGLVSSHNYDLACKFAKKKEVYAVELAKEVELLKKKLNELTI